MGRQLSVNKKEVILQFICKNEKICSTPYNILSGMHFVFCGVHLSGRVTLFTMVVETVLLE